jgi:hypothetical protein
MVLGIIFWGTQVNPRVFAGAFFCGPGVSLGFSLLSLRLTFRLVLLRTRERIDAKHHKTTNNNDGEN